MTSSQFVRAIRDSDLPAGAQHAIDISGKSILLCKLNGQIYAISNICSHANEKLECGRMANGWIACPVHGARFELATGKVKNPPATRPIATYNVRVVDEWIEVEA